MQTAKQALIGSVGPRFAVKQRKRTGRKLRKLFRSVVTQFAAILSPWAWSVAQKKPHRMSKLRVVAAMVAIFAVLIAPVMLGSGFHLVSQECSMVSCGFYIDLFGMTFLAVLCGGLAGPAAYACEAVWLA